MSNSTENQKPEIGMRIELNDHYGTIRYIGRVENKPSIWLGIDWDDPNRGKHDGTVEGRRYFSAKHKTSGSLIRPEKANLGKSIVEAISLRYGKSEVVVASDVLLDATFNKMVGFDDVRERQSDFDNLEIVNVRLQHVSSTGMVDQLKNLCPNVTELDVSKNLLSNWSQVFRICEQLRYLHRLNVSENLLAFPEEVPKRFSNLKILICGSSRLVWDDVLVLGTAFPYLQELRVPLNSIKEINLSNCDSFGSLEVLDVEGNKIEDWEEILKLGLLPNLREIILGNVGLRRIRFAGRGKTRLFPALKKLAISDNEIDNWESIGELDKLENLEDLRFLRNPILETENYDFCIQMIVGRVGGLKVLNGTEVKCDDRRGAEYDYIKKYGLEWLRARGGEERDEFLNKHNRYESLVEIYGELEVDELKVETNLIKDMLIDVALVCGSETVRRGVPATMSVQKLKVICQKLFGLREKPELIYTNSSKGIEVLLDDEARDVGFYSVEDGDEIVVKGNKGG